MRPWLALLAIACATPRVHHRARSPGRPWLARLARNGQTIDASRARLGMFAPVAIREVALAPAPGAVPGGVALEPGFPLPSTVASWLHVHVDHPVALDGWVPASARGLFWQEPEAEPATVQLDATTIVHDAPAADAAVVAVLDRNVRVELAGQLGAWSSLTTVVGRVRVTGWAIVSARARPPGEINFEVDDVIEGELVRPEGVRP